MNNVSLRALKTFKALSNVIRYKIICLLAEQKYETGELAKKVNRRISTVSQHLKILKDLDIVDYYTHQNKVIYSLRNKKIYEIIKQMELIFKRVEISESISEFSKIPK